MSHNPTRDCDNNKVFSSLESTTKISHADPFKSQKNSISKIEWKKMYKNLDRNIFFLFFYDFEFVKCRIGFYWHMKEEFFSLDCTTMSQNIHQNLGSFYSGRSVQNNTMARHPDMSPKFGLAALILGGAVIIILLVCACIDLIMVYVCCIYNSPLRRYNEKNSR